MTSGAEETSDAEEARWERAALAMPAVAGRYQDLFDAPERLWARAVADAQAGRLDDRPLYWARLAALRGLAGEGAARAEAERRSRGFDGPWRDGPTAFVTGFDPFHLDRDVTQSNPSGLAALALHDAIIAGVHIRAAILPVRFADFDQGVVERVLRPAFLRQPKLVVTASMGRDGFDLERFPGLRRSSSALDNRNASSGASERDPRPPPKLDGPEFLEFSLPAAAMTSASGRWPVRDNRVVCTLERGERPASSLAELAGETAVRGSGGGYLSNEIAYRALLLQRQLGGDFPLGHVHLPAVHGYDAEREGEMVDQMRRLLDRALRA